MASTSRSPRVDSQPHDTELGWPHPIYSSDSIVHHKSGFQAHATIFRPSSTPDSTQHAQSLEPLFEHLQCTFPKIKRATHQMYAWRAYDPHSPSLSSSSPPTASGSSDGGESGAGERLARLLELSDCSDVVVVVYRWYGGVQLGSERWKCISGVAKEALRAGGFIGGSSEPAERKARDTGTVKSGKGKKGKKR